MEASDGVGRICASGFSCGAFDSFFPFLFFAILSVLMLFNELFVDVEFVCLHFKIQLVYVSRKCFALDTNLESACRNVFSRSLINYKLFHSLNLNIS